MANGFLCRFGGIFQNMFGSTKSTLLNNQGNQVIKLDQPVRFKFADWRMIRDYKRRKCVAQYGAERMRINSLRKNDILPPELQEVAQREVVAMPRDSNFIRINFRCAVTSRSRGVVYRWRLSRMVWRHLADYNKLSGVQRALW
nr:EOG090X0MNX [Sida crystallina]